LLLLAQYLNTVHASSYFMSLLSYLNESFYCAETLCQALKIEAETLQQWQEKGLFPKPSYCIQNRIQCSSYYGLHESDEYRDYYPRGLINWGLQLLKAKISTSSGACNLFMQQYALAMSKLPLDIFSLDADYESEMQEQLTSSWQHFLTGKYGAQTANGSIDDIVTLDVARYQIDRITEAMALEELDQAQRKRLHPVLKLINRALGHGPEHEEMRSLRRRYVDALILKYDLSLKA